MRAGEIRYAIVDGICVIRMEGRLTYTLGVCFGAFVDGLFDDGTVRDVVVDLAQAVYLDSTILGLLGKMANGAHRHLHRKVTIAAPCENVRQLLRNIGFDDVFVILNDWRQVVPDLREIPMEEQSGSAQAKVVRDAHQTLMKMNDANAVRFRNVVEVLDHEINSHNSTQMIKI